jgi:hypothetical protein
VRPGWLIVVTLQLATHPAGAQLPLLRVDSTRGRLEVVFPALPLSTSGCRYSGNVSAETGRLYSWRVSAAFPDSRYPMNHIFALWFHFFFPDTVELTETRFDSVVAVNRPRVAELYGEPPSARTYHHLNHSSVRRDSGRLTLLIKGREAVDALLQTGAVSVGLSWCEGSQSPPTFRVVRLERE